MSKFKKYRRTQIAEMRPVEHYECRAFHTSPITKGVFMSKPIFLTEGVEVSISSEDLKNGSPKLGDMIARNPENHNDQWLVSAEYYKDNFEPLNEEE